MASKVFNIGYGSGYSVYGVFIRRSDGAYYDKAPQDQFVVSPTDPYIALTEDSLAKGFYVVTIPDSTNEWLDGTYDVVFYDQSGGAPNPSVDVNIGNSQFEIKNNAVLTLNALGASLADDIFTTIIDNYKYVSGSFGKKMAELASDPIREFGPNA